jgi:RNA polymerase sigma-70 factor (ECF subfamily)
VSTEQRELINACKKRDRKAQYAFYKEYFAYLFSICIRYTRDKEEAMGILNLSFARIMLNLDKYDEAQELKFWIRRVTVNCIIDEFRKTKSYKEQIELKGDLHPEWRSNGSDFQSIGNNLSEVVQRQLLSLSPITRNVFNLYAVDGYKHREIAEMLNISENASAWHFSVARKCIQDFLLKENKLVENGRASA